MRPDSKVLKIFLIFTVLSLIFVPDEVIPEESDSETEMVVKDIVRDSETGSPVLILEDKKHSLVLPIFIGVNEAQSIALELGKINRLRPLTHDLLRNILKTMNIKVERVLINDLRDDTYYALIYLNFKGNEVKIDSRPSDAIALALRTNSPIFTLNTVLKKAPVIKLTEEAPVEEIWGVAFQDLSSDLAAFFGLKDVNGVLVASVREGVSTPLIPGDVLLKINEHRVIDLADFRKKAHKLKSGGVIILTLHRSGNEVSYSITSFTLNERKSCSTTLLTLNSVLV